MFFARAVSPHDVWVEVGNKGRPQSVEVTYEWPMQKRSLVEKLRGVSRLVVEATQGVTSVVESMHVAIGSGPEVLGKPLESLTKLVTAPTYSAVRGVTRVVGSSLDQALSLLGKAVTAEGTSGGLGLAALNGVLGDYLEETGNPLTTQMSLWSQGELVGLGAEALKKRFPEGDSLVFFVHGSSLDETCWKRQGSCEPETLAASVGLTPIFLRYNSGLHVSENGSRFAALLETLVRAWPRAIRDLVFIGHSMGGLVCRSACAVAEVDSLSWRPHLKALVTLGTPHHGSPLERSGNWFECMLEISRYSAPLSTLGKIRSAGVTDLRYGTISPDDWKGRDRFRRPGDPRTAVALPHDVACFAVAGQRKAKVPSDGLVPVDSALGRHAKAELTLHFGSDRQFIAENTKHLELLNSRVVFQQVHAWLAEVFPTTGRIPS
jgi:pimeloyl-ACP methyl ester carboxylesterase